MFFKFLFISLLPISLYSFVTFAIPGNYEKLVAGDEKLADDFCGIYSIFDNGKVMLKDRSWKQVTADMTSKYCEVGAKAGYATSQYQYASYLINIRQYDLGISYYEASAKQGNLDAKYALSGYYTQIPKYSNPTKAYEYYNEIINEDKNEFRKNSAKCNLAGLYASGNGVLRNYKKAKTLIEDAFANSKQPMVKEECSKIWKKYSLDLK